MATTFDQTLQDELIRRVRDVVEPVRVILFGSAARGEMHENSDIDVLVVIDEDLKCRDITGDIYRKLIGYSLPVDVIVATEDDLTRYGDNFSLVYYPALREGRDIYVH